MRPNPASQIRPFDQGATSVKLQDGMPNPFAEGSIEFRNYELGRAYALEARTTFAVGGAYVAQGRHALAKAPR